MSEAAPHLPAPGRVRAGARRRWAAPLLLLLLGCEAAAPTPTTPEVWWHSGDAPPPVVASPPAGPSAGREERLLAIVRRSLRRRGLGPEIAGGPMIVVPSADHPEAELAIEGPEAGRLFATWPPGAGLVVTAGGRWWVWEYGSTAPADAAAQELAGRAGTRGL